MSASLPRGPHSRFARLYGGEPGIDPYTRVVSDLYQDLFQEGSFIGKGIYDVAAFEEAVKGRFPENRILSHDLLEGCYARSGLLSDVQLYEEYPTRYGADVDRRYRWIRGDWQLAAWLLPRVPGPDGRRLDNPLSLLSRWKLLDNLRRSLVPGVLTMLLLLGWPLSSWVAFWTLAVLGVLLIPPLLATLLGVLRKPDDMGLGQHLAHQHGPGAAREPGRLRLRLHPGRALARSVRQHPGDHGRSRAPPGPLLQLVRHPVAATPAPGLRLDRGQRQPGGPPADPAAGPDGAARSTHPGAALGARTCNGLPPPGPRGGSDCTRPSTTPRHGSGVARPRPAVATAAGGTWP